MSRRSHPLTCSHFAGPCCECCHDNDAEGDRLDTMVEVKGAGGLVFARVCCHKVDAAEALLKAPFSVANH